jgi:hypothetical protein
MNKNVEMIMTITPSVAYVERNMIFLSPALRRLAFLALPFKKLHICSFIFGAVFRLLAG